ncbi:uncharacterized protein B0H18DRAFT_439195 [Fomitopsis serialis]|uniref:uncharacterized protein n=1 Tax=Fomitopsis serialis TaxID=139415 RepID=UPI0020072F0A|nr:uncharacterized protein B0H18DRAFT_439195 [Neoantrodia serialis]KAH9924219.1 hypothetical protein B0H18DRAFT_439195 [Neoantrodia serialis]
MPPPSPYDVRSRYTFCKRIRQHKPFRVQDSPVATLTISPRHSPDDRPSCVCRSRSRPVKSYCDRKSAVATAKLLAPLILRWLERVPSCLQPITMLDNVAPCLVHAEDRAVDVTRGSPKTHGRACRRRRRSVRWKAICRVFAGPVAFEDCTTRLPRASPAHSSRIVLIARRHGPARRTAMCRVFDGRVAFQPRGRSEETAVTSRATDDETFMVEVAVVL